MVAYFKKKNNEKTPNQQSVWIDSRPKIERGTFEYEAKGLTTELLHSVLCESVMVNTQACYHNTLTLWAGVFKLQHSVYMMNFLWNI